MTQGVATRPGSNRTYAPRPGIFRVLRVSRLVDRVLRGAGGARRRVLQPGLVDTGNDGGSLRGVLRLGGASWRAIGGVWKWIRPRRGPECALSTSSLAVAVNADSTRNEENNIVQLDGQARKDLDVEQVLEKSCLPSGIFSFCKVCKETRRDGVLVLEAWSKGADENGELEWCENGLSMSEIGRQLGMLGVVAVSEIGPESMSHFCLADTALVDEYGATMDPRIPLKGDYMQLMMVFLDKMYAHNLHSSLVWAP